MPARNFINCGSFCHLTQIQRKISENFQSNTCTRKSLNNVVKHNQVKISCDERK